MKVYVIAHPGATPEELAPDATELVLGERGRGRWEVRIPIRGTGPYVEFRRYRDSKRPYMVRHNASKSSGRKCLIAINALGGYKRGAEYLIRAAKALEVLERGKSAFGEAGRVGYGEHTLAVAEEGSEFCLRGVSGLIFSYVYKHGKWIAETEGERNARYMMEALIDGRTEFVGGVFKPLTLDMKGLHEGIEEEVVSFKERWRSLCRTLPEQNYTLTGNGVGGIEPVFVMKATQIPSSKEWPEYEQRSQRQKIADPFDHNYLAVPAKGQKADLELVLVKEYKQGRRSYSARKPFVVNPKSFEEVGVEVLGQAEAHPRYGLERWTLVSAPLGWAARQLK